MSGGRGHLPPIGCPVVLDPFGQAIVADPDGDYVCVSVRHGLNLAWTSLDETHLLMPMFFGGDRDIAVALTLSHVGLDRLIGDLQSIQTQVRTDRRQSAVDGASPVPPFAGGAPVDPEARG